METSYQYKINKHVNTGGLDLYNYLKKIVSIKMLYEIIRGLEHSKLFKWENILIFIIPPTN